MESGAGGGQQYPPGWYPDRDAPEQLRWWDGTRWTEHVHRQSQPPPPPRSQTQPQAPGQPQASAQRSAQDSPQAPATRGPKKPWYRRTWVLVTGGVLLLLIVVGALLPAPEEEDSGDNGGAETSSQAEEVKRVNLELDAPSQTTKRFAIVTGTVDPPTASVRIARPIETGDTRVEVANGQFRARVKLARGDNKAIAYASAPGYEDARDQTVSIQRTETAAERRARVARAQARREAQAAKRRESFINSAQTIPYAQLQKDPNAHVGKKVKYYGRIFQIQQEGSFGVILLSVTDEGYDFWSDEIWINYAGTKVSGAEGDFLTVYGVVEGQKSFETQIGGERYVPEITAEFIEE